MFLSHKHACENSGFAQPVMISRSAHTTSIADCLSRWDLNPLINSSFMTPYYHCMTASLRNIVHPNCTLSNVFGDSVSFLSSPGFRYEELQGEAAKGQASALSDGTKHNYRSIWSLYDEFTRFHNLKPFPATPEILSSFITLVGFSVKSHKTVYNIKANISGKRKRTGAEYRCLT